MTFCPLPWQNYSKRRTTYIKGLVDLGHLEVVRDELVNHQLLVHVLGDEGGHAVAGLPATEGGALPDAASHQLEGAGADLLSGAGHPDDGGHAPALVARLQGGALPQGDGERSADVMSHTHSALSYTQRNDGIQQKTGFVSGRDSQRRADLSLHQNWSSRSDVFTQ